MERMVRGVLMAAWFTAACGDCSSEREAAEAFIESHGECSVDADCVVQTVGCAEVESAFCGQVTLSRAAAASAEWKALQQDLADCEDGSCAMCAAALVPTCVNSKCGR